MTSIFDQFEQETLNPRTSTSSNFSTAEMSRMGYINILEQEEPIFSKIKKDFNPSDKITHIVLENGYLVAALANNTLFRLNVHNKQQNDEIIIPKMSGSSQNLGQPRLSNLFLDPSGNHLLVSFSKVGEAGPELLYLNRKSNKLKFTSKFKGHKITEVAWNNFSSTESTTGPILLGTSMGVIFETEIFAEGDSFFTSNFSSIEQYCKQVFDLGKDNPITGLKFFKNPFSNRYVIFACSPTSLYQFTGSCEQEEKPMLQQVFNKYLGLSDKDTFITVQSSLRYSRLKFYSENLVTPTALAWMTENGILYAPITLEDDLKAINEKKKYIPFPKPIHIDYAKSPKFPISLAVTEFHILLAYSDSIKGVCLLNHELVYEDNYNEAFGKLINLVKDSQTGNIWAITENSLFKFKITKEERNVWEIFAENRQFELARKYSRDNEVCYNQVLIKEAEYLFEQGQYELSAEGYAETHFSFEAICLKFMEVGQQDALITFLEAKLNNISSEQKTQVSMIVLLLIELYLSKLEEKRLSGQEQSTAYLDTQKKFQMFLGTDKVKSCVDKNKSTIYKLMSSHGDKHNLNKLTIVNKDFEQLIRQHIYQNNFHKAVEVLESQNNYELYYQFAPILMSEVPMFMIKALMEAGRKLDPVRLLPAFVTCDSEQHSKEVIKYLDYCINTLKATDMSLHNLLISLYAKINKSKLMDYLEDQGKDLKMINYDIHFALRLCQEQKVLEACVHLFSMLSLYESAIDLALKINVELAKNIANQPPEEDIELRKKLWRKIAQHVVSMQDKTVKDEKDNIKNAMEFLKKCHLIKIEDILPFFPDFVTIDHFKDAICSSLQEYNQHIQDLKEEMEDATKSAELVREDIQSFRNRYTFISTDDNCEICGVKLMIKVFYIFPCQHKFHTDCLKSELEPLLGPAKRNKLYELEKILKSLNSDNLSTGSGLSNRDLCKQEIDNILASECLYCGENMIQNIDKPFVDDSVYERIKKEWE